MAAKVIIVLFLTLLCKVYSKEYAEFIDNTEYFDNTEYINNIGNIENDEYMDFEPGSRPPRIEEITSNLNIINHQIVLKKDMNENIELTCRVEDGTIPSPVVTWYKNNKILDFSTERISTDASKENMIRFVGKISFKQN
jgi:hypothetical protein